MQTQLHYFLALFLLVLFASCKPAPELMSFEKLSKTNQKIPDVLYLSKGKKQLKYFGTYHSFNPKDSIFSKIKRVYDSFKPDFVLHEGGDNWPMLSTFDSTIVVSGDPGSIRFLASKDNVPYQSLEPSEQTEFKHLLEHFEKDLVTLFYFCRQMHQQQRRNQNVAISDADFKKKMEGFLSYLKQKGIPLKQEELTLTFWETYYNNFFNQKLEWRLFDPGNYYPNVFRTKINEINRASGHLRNEHMVHTIFEALANNNKVMVLVGGSHLVIQKDLITYRFNKLR